jgi:DNA polymerase-3 subunit delta
MTRYADFETSLKGNRFHPNYFLFGSDPGLVEMAQKALIGAIQQASQGQLSVMTVDLDETSVDEVLNSFQHLTLFAPLRVIVVKSVMRLKETQGKRLARYFENPNPQTTVVFVAGELDRDQRKKKIFEILTRGTQAVELTRLEGREISDWLQRHAQERGCSLAPDAVQFLLELQGNDLGRLQQELEKALLYAGSGNEVTLAIVEAVSGFAAGHTLSEFIDAIATKDKVKALALQQEIFFSGKETGLAFWWFSQQLRQWLQFRELAGKLSPAVIGKRTGVYNASVAGKMADQARRFSSQSLAQALHRLAAVDHKVKSSTVDARFTMELLVHDLTT